MYAAFGYGFILSLGLIIPLGMQNIFIFNQGAQQPHFVRAFPSALTAAICDNLLILAGVLGVSVAVWSLPWLKLFVLGFGFVFLLFIAWTTWRSQSQINNKDTIPLTVKQQILYAMSVSILNPHAIIDSISVIGTSSVHFSGTEKISYTLACMTVSTVWFFGLSLSGHFLRRIDQSGSWIVRINKLSVLIILVVAGILAKELFDLIF